MVITIIAEPRSGSTNLTHWFYFNKNFTTLFEPLNPSSNWFQNNTQPINYEYKTTHLCLKEIYNPDKELDSIIKISDKIIILYRENKQEQLESYLNAIRTNDWHKQYVYLPLENDFINEKTKYFDVLKSQFKKQYIDKNYFKISYEELYYNNGFQKIVDYIDLDCVKYENFPYGLKYRINVNRKKNII